MKTYLINVIYLYIYNVKIEYILIINLYNIYMIIYINMRILMNYFNKQLKSSQIKNILQILLK